jgi:apolipoprotein N-acyltransferase
VSWQVAAAAAVVSGLFVALSFPSTEVWILAWTGLVPLLLAVRGRSLRAALGLGCLGGLAFYLVALYWISPTISNFTRISPLLAHGVLILLAGVCASFVGMFAVVVEWLAMAGISRVISAPLVWVVLEWSRSFVPAGFPWVLLGYSQYRVGPVIQVADLGGVYLVSALVVLVNAVIVEAVMEGPRRHRLLIGTTIAVLVAALGYGSWRLAEVGALPASRTIRVGLVQGNIAQDRKWDRAFEDHIFERYLTLSEAAVADNAELIVWPEAAVPFALPYDQRTARLLELSARSRASLLVGAPGIQFVGEGRYVQFNRAWLIDPDDGLVAHYDKIQLVPFGEYVPFGWLMSWVDKAVQAIGDFGRGTEYVVFDVPTATATATAADGTGATGSTGVACLICYEGIFPDLTRRFVARGARLLVNISNDAWYGRTSAPYQHLAMAAVRAVENRVSVVRATNTGVTAVIDPVGRVRGQTSLFEEAVVVDDVAIVETTSLYRLVGDAFVYLCILAVALLAGLRVRLGAVLIRRP